MRLRRYFLPFAFRLKSPCQCGYDAMGASADLYREGLHFRGILVKRLPTILIRQLRHYYIAAIP